MARTEEIKNGIMGNKKRFRKLTELSKSSTRLFREQIRKYVVAEAGRLKIKLSDEEMGDISYQLTKMFA